MARGVGVRPGREGRPVSVRLRIRRLTPWVFVAVPVILGGCFSVRVVENQAILYICSKVVCFLVSRPAVRPGRWARPSETWRRRLCPALRTWRGCWDP